MTYVYILSIYEEHGAEAVKATLDKSKLPEMLKGLSFTPMDYDNDLVRLNKLLSEKTDQELLNIGESVADTRIVGPQGWPVGYGWGGPSLHVVEIE